jgi:UDP-3-O-[3-hydroxymyristoyl] N-acetylglucosamine deacetylase
MKQKTLKSEISFQGIGIHSGQKAHLTLKPAKIDQGIVFVRKDKHNASIKLEPNNFVLTKRASTLQVGNLKISTPEHLLAAAYALGISNLIVEIDTEEIPILDGSSKDFVKYFKKAGIITLAKETKICDITQEICVTDGEASIKVKPDKCFRITYILDYAHKFIGLQTLSLVINEKNFVEEIALARTYGFEAEYEELLKRGLAKGGSLKNAILIGEKGYLSELRCSDELIKHKILDLVGDLAVLNKRIKGHFVACKSGHCLNRELVLKLSGL